ncbi:T9SS type A sorting domain-containing protein [Dyadobacter sp. CY261]|uniref:T9SS type A sorting domain-containing protein n=1 Tax=Dyadobacter sp. CY261 TaxID=2907203 RepID=UPI001F193233|nr:T9SS type A sorting domain-containing protein [Dyadobacter sp. CY261]MCF0072796.1 T9SS type A sorting domain-containing protein [Dyadobacter sp. CY261]
MKPPLKKSLLPFIFLLGLLCPYLLKAQWQSIGSEGFSTGTIFRNSIAFASDNTLYVAYSDAANGQRITVKKFVSGAWTTVGNTAFAGGQGGQICSMVLTKANIPYVGVVSGTDLQASVWKLNGSVWEKVGTDISDNMAGGIEIAINSADEVYAMYKDEFRLGKATVKKYNGVVWETVGAAGFSEDGIQSFDFAIDGNGILYAAYEDLAHSLKGTVQKFNGTAWEVVGTAGFTTDWAKCISLAIKSDNVPYFAFRDSGTFNRANCMWFNGTAWELVGPATGISPSAIDNPGGYIALTFDRNDKPYLAYHINSSPFSITVKSFSGTTWDLVGIANFTGTTVGDLSIAMDAFDNPYVSFQDGRNGFKATVAAFIVNNPMPVKLTAFTGKYIPSEKAVSLEWTTSEESNSDRFEIEAGAEPTKLHKVGEVAARGEHTGITNYVFSDRETAGSTLYYRLKQIDLDGSFVHSKIISISKPDSDDLLVLENPVRNDIIRINTSYQQGKKVKLELLNTSGQLLRKWVIPSQPEFRLDASGLASGLYILKFEDQDDIRNIRVVKQ